MVRQAPLILALAAPLLAAPGPCLTATPDCTERVALGAQGRFITVYRNYALTQPQPQATHAVILVHGTNRNGDGYYRTLLAAAAVAGRLHDAVLISPTFKGNDGASCRDPLAPGEIGWTCNGWKDGQAAATNPPGETLYSFDAADRLIDLLNDASRFPNLRSIVVAGHSAGGQYLHRYTASNRAHARSRLPIRYVVANPSSYLYLDDHRPRTHSTDSFTPYWDRENCTTYNDFKYGLNRRSGYAAQLDDATLRRQLATRDVTYLVGELDTLEDSGLDLTCPARAQGPNRRERGLAYFNYIRTRFQAQHRLHFIPGCGHSATCIYSSDSGARTLFPAPSAAQ